jgi:hypothetical protein
LERGVDVLAALTNYNREIDKNKNFDYTYYPYPDKWLKEEMMQYAMKEGVKMNPDTILEHLHAFVEYNTGGGRYPMSEPFEKSCSKQIQNYKDALCGRERPLKHESIITEIIRMRKAEPLEENQLTVEKHGLLEHCREIETMMADNRDGYQISHLMKRNNNE